MWGAATWRSVLFISTGVCHCLNALFWDRPLTVSSWANFLLTVSSWANFILTVSSWTNFILTVSSWANFILTVLRWANFILTVSSWANFFLTLSSWANFLLTVSSWANFLSLSCMTFSCCLRSRQLTYWLWCGQHESSLAYRTAHPPRWISACVFHNNRFCLSFPLMCKVDSPRSPKRVWYGKVSDPMTEKLNIVIVNG